MVPGHFVFRSNRALVIPVDVKMSEVLKHQLKICEARPRHTRVWRRITPMSCTEGGLNANTLRDNDVAVSFAIRDRIWIYNRADCHIHLHQLLSSYPALLRKLLFNPPGIGPAFSLHLLHTGRPSVRTTTIMSSTKKDMRRQDLSELLCPVVLRSEVFSPMEQDFIAL
jgi:hypothetical protein